MKKSILVLIALIFAFSLTSCRLGGKRGSGRIAEEKREISDFSEIELGGSYNVDITVGEETSLTIEGDDNLLKYVRTYVRGKKLIIDTERNINPRKDILVTITTPELDELYGSGACDIFIDKIKSETFYLNMSGACSIKANGHVDKLKIQISGAGSVDAERLIANAVKVDISGASSASVYADEYLQATVSGVGSIDYYGDPDDVDSNVSGIGSINRK
jgi:hypothetical protein